jgi:hypothetical protein
MLIYTRLQTPERRFNPKFKDRVAKNIGIHNSRNIFGTQGISATHYPEPYLVEMTVARYK